MPTTSHPGFSPQDYASARPAPELGRPKIAVIVALWAALQQNHPAQEMGKLTTTACQTIAQAGGDPVVLDSSSPQQQTQSTTEHEQFAGFVYLGGADVHPGYYTSVPVEQHIPHIDAAADKFCLDSLAWAIQHNKPTLAICRGAQLLNVSLGGTLIQHLDGHRIEQPSGVIEFKDQHANLKPGSKVAKIFGQQRLPIRCSHHQAIDQLAHGLEVTGQADDGIIEAVEHQEHPWLIGLQWHPEEANSRQQDIQALATEFLNQVHLGL